MTPRFDNQIVVRVPAALMDALRRDAELYGRTVAQSARFYLTIALANSSPTA